MKRWQKLNTAVASRLGSRGGERSGAERVEIRWG